MTRAFQLLFGGNIKRMPFFLITLGIYAILAIFILTGIYKNINININALLFPFFILILAIYSKRLRDIGLSPWFSLLALLNPLGTIGSAIAGCFYIFLLLKKSKLQ